MLTMLYQIQSEEEQRQEGRADHAQFPIVVVADEYSMTKIHLIYTLIRPTIALEISNRTKRDLVGWHYLFHPAKYFSMPLQRVFRLENPMLEIVI